jgi:hypothetical protein
MHNKVMRFMENILRHSLWSSADFSVELCREPAKMQRRLIPATEEDVMYFSWRKKSTKRTCAANDLLKIPAVPLKEKNSVASLL